MLGRIKNHFKDYIICKKNAAFETELRKRLTAKDFTILCSNCIGGIIYNRLGLKFLSPTINMYFTQRDFIRFAVNLDHYLGCELEFIQSDKPFPVAKLDDITLYFNHSENQEQAANDWTRRKLRINPDNIYIIFYYRDGYKLEELREIEKANCKRIILLTNKPLDLEYTVCQLHPESQRIPFSDAQKKMHEFHSVF